MDWRFLYSGGGPLIVRCREGVLGRDRLLLSAKILGYTLYTFCHKEETPLVLHRLGIEPPEPPPPAQRPEGADQGADATGAAGVRRGRRGCWSRPVPVHWGVPGGFWRLHGLVFQTGLGRGLCGLGWRRGLFSFGGGGGAKGFGCPH